MFKTLFTKILPIVLLMFSAAVNLQAQSWTPLVSGTTQLLNSVHFANDNTGWVCGDDNTVRKTTNGGVNWTAQTTPLPSNYDLNDIFFTNEQVGWIAADNNRVLFTNNGGATWSLQATGEQANTLYSIFFINPSNGWVVGEDGYMRRTVNGGVNWVSQGSGTSNSLLSVFFPSGGGTGWIAGESGNIRKSVDFGVNWTAQTSQSQLINSLYMLNANEGFCVGQNGLIRRTNNGGSSWSSQTSGLSVEFKGVHFINANTGWIAGMNGTILKTTNAGTSWQSDATGISNSFWAVHFASTAGYIVGSGGAIYKYSTTTAVNNYSSEIPAQFKLHTNYPNPFNPSTTIKFDIPEASGVKLAVYDMLGREISVLVNEQLNAGMYETTFNASALSSGTYIYRLEAGEFSSVQKMILVK